MIFIACLTYNEPHSKHTRARRRKLTRRDTRRCAQHTIAQPRVVAAVFMVRTRLPNVVLARRLSGSAAQQTHERFYISHTFYTFCLQSEWMTTKKARTRTRAVFVIFLSIFLVRSHCRCTSSSLRHYLSFDTTRKSLTRVHKYSWIKSVMCEINDK